MVCPIPRSGKYGFVGDYTGAVLTRFRRVKDWTFDSISQPETRVYSGTRGGTQRIPGFIESKGTFSGFGGVPPLFVGDSFTFLGYTAPTTGVPCTPGCAYSVLALVDTLSITWNWTAENKGVSWQIGFSSNEVPTVISAFDDPCDDLVYCDPNPCNLTFLMNNACDPFAAVEWCNLVSATLNFTASNIPYSNNSTGCFIKRDVGNLDWTLEVVDQNPCIIPVINADYKLTLMAETTPTTWLLNWGQFQGVTNFTVNTQTGEMIQKTNTFAMQAVNCCVPGTPVRGSILSPAGVTLWPYSTPS